MIRRLARAVSARTKRRPSSSTSGAPPPDLHRPRRTHSRLPGRVRVPRRLIEWLKAPLPADKTLVTLGVVEPFTTAVKVSGLAAIAIVLPILVWQAWGFLAPAMDEATQRTLRWFIVLATSLSPSASRSRT